MPFSDDIFLPDNQCEICGAELSDEVVIQEFADGSIARLCAECAAGAALQAEGSEFRFPDPTDAAGEYTPREAGAGDELFLAVGATTAPVAPAPPPVAIELDALEKTRELLTPVVDLITLQQEMQGALQRLAASLQTFATGVISDNIGKTATVESRLETLERELHFTRARLRDTEALLARGGAAPVTAPPGAAPAADTSFWYFDATMESAAEKSLGDTFENTAETSLADVEESLEPQTTRVATPGRPVESDSATQPYSLSDLQSTLPPIAPPLAPPPVAPPAGPATAEHHNRPGFALAEVQVAQKYFNDSQFTNRIREVRKSLGKPKANVTKVVGAEPRALVTVAWDIIWYQYLVDLRRDVPTDQRVTLHREGMDLDELTPVFKEKNASVDDEGRLDASELEVKLLSDPSTLITEMTVDEERALEDATEEIWDQRTAPEFKWDS
jgi:hypothetical protein